MMDSLTFEYTVLKVSVMSEIQSKSEKSNPTPLLTGQLRDSIFRKYISYMYPTDTESRLKGAQVRSAPTCQPDPSCTPRHTERPPAGSTDKSGFSLER